MGKTHKLLVLVTPGQGRKKALSLLCLFSFLLQSACIFFDIKNFHKSKQHQIQNDRRKVPRKKKAQGYTVAGRCVVLKTKKTRTPDIPQKGLEGGKSTGLLYY